MEFERVSERTDNPLERKKNYYTNSRGSIHTHTHGWQLLAAISTNYIFTLRYPGRTQVEEKRLK